MTSKPYLYSQKATWSCNSDIIGTGINSRDNPGPLALVIL